MKKQWPFYTNKLSDLLSKSPVSKSNQGVEHNESLFDWTIIFQTPALSLASLGKSAGTRSTSQSWGESFRELSPYTNGANPKNVHWPRWIQRQELSLKKYDLPQQGKVVIVLDESGSMSTGKQYLYARVCAAKLATACVKAGHQVLLFVERGEGFCKAPLIYKLDHIIRAFSIISSAPLGLSSSLETRNKYLAQIASNDHLIYLSDALYTIGNFMHPLDNDKATKIKEKLCKEKLSSVIEQLGPGIQAMYCLYICCIDPSADHPIALETLKSSESDYTINGILTEQQAEFAYQRLLEYRQKQKDLLLSRQNRVQWYELNSDLNFDIQFRVIVELLRQS